MGLQQLFGFIRDAVMHVIVIMLALILLMIVASRNVEYQLEQAAQAEVVPTEISALLL